MDQGTHKSLKPLTHPGMIQEVDMATLDTDWTTFASLASNLFEQKVVKIGAGEGYWEENKQYLPTFFTKMPWDEDLCQHQPTLTEYDDNSPLNPMPLSPNIIKQSVPEDEEIKGTTYDNVGEIVIRLPCQDNPSNTIVLRMANPKYSETENNKERTQNDTWMTRTPP
ncbi:hypothetical protein Pmani_023897 [Petrolisthes manimaculis]|uniref:Uncharacterized protein n=1 Tax=Petrolisthes manimaculis TaxID=1843537 RepID=A0AAE1P9U1_9EUCA|nr:hypothetical protein Pmani_023897 [Petrolisthes manimaculis]